MELTCLLLNAYNIKNIRYAQHKKALTQIQVMRTLRDNDKISLPQNKTRVKLRNSLEKQCVNYAQITLQIMLQSLVVSPFI